MLDAQKNGMHLLLACFLIMTSYINLKNKPLRFFLIESVLIILLMLKKNENRVFGESRYSDYDGMVMKIDNRESRV